MKRIGLIGGLGPEATVDYYKEIINAFKGKEKIQVYPEIIVYSVNMWEFLTMMKRKEYDKATDFLLGIIEALKKAGAEFAAITANTPHLLFESLSKRSLLPLISIVEATCREAAGRKLNRPGLLGTGFTMGASFYQDVFKKQDMEIVTPDKEDQEIINFKLFSEIELGIFKPETRDMLIGIISKMVALHHINSIILGCTEFPLILTETEYAGIPVLNTTLIHVQEIVRYCTGNSL
jgi:aspartate racemase